MWGAFPAWGGNPCRSSGDEIDVNATGPDPGLDRHIARFLQFADVALDGPASQPGAFAEAGNGWIAAPSIISVIRQREHYQALRWTERFTFKHRRHDADAHTVLRFLSSAGSPRIGPNALPAFCGTTIR